MKDYDVALETLGRPYDPSDEALYVTVTGEDGIRYHAPFVTPRFIKNISEKNRATGECLDGTYFSMPGMIVVSELTEPRIRATIDNLLENHEFNEYFRKD
jgi:hypothetical protein